MTKTLVRQLKAARKERDEALGRVEQIFKALEQELRMHQQISRQGSRRKQR